MTSDSKRLQQLAYDLRLVRGVRLVEAVEFHRAYKVIDGRGGHFTPDPVPNGALVFMETDDPSEFTKSLEAIWAVAQRSTTTIVRMTPMDSW